MPNKLSFLVHLLFRINRREIQLYTFIMFQGGERQLGNGTRMREERSETYKAGEVNVKGAGERKGEGI